MSLIWHTLDQKTGASGATGVTDIVVTKPDNVVEGDLIVVKIGRRYGSASDVGGTWPAGFTLRNTPANSTSDWSPTTWLFTKIATASEPATYTFSFNESEREGSWIAGRVTGHNPEEPIRIIVDAINLNENEKTSNGSPNSISGLDVLEGNMLISTLSLAGSDSTPDSISQPSGMDQEFVTLESSVRVSFSLATEQVTVDGASGAREWTWTQSGTELLSYGILFEIQAEDADFRLDSPEDNALNVPIDGPLEWKNPESDNSNIHIYNDSAETSRVKDIFSTEEQAVLDPVLNNDTDYWWKGRPILKLGTSGGTTLYTESWDYANQAGWPGWTTRVLGGTGNHEILTNRAIIEADADSFVVADLDDISVEDFVYEFTYNVNQVSNDVQYNFYWRTQEDWFFHTNDTYRRRGYWLWIWDGKLHLGLTRGDNQNEVVSSIAIPFVLTAGVDVIVEVTVNGATHDLRFYEASGVRPSDPTLTMVEDTWGGGGIAHMLAPGTVDPGRQLSFGAKQITLPAQQVQILDTTVGDSKVTIERSSVPVRDSYVVRYRPTGGTYVEPIDVGLTNPFDVTGLTNDQEYGFQVAEVISSSIGNWSAEVLATPTAGSVTSISFDQTDPEVEINGTRRLSVSYVTEGNPSKDTQFIITSGATGVSISKVSETQVDVIAGETAVAGSSVTIEAVSIFDETKTDSIIVNVVEPPDIPDNTEGDMEALNALYDSTNGTNWENKTGWPISSVGTMGDAFGVTVYPSGHAFEGRVARVQLNWDGQGDPINDPDSSIWGNGLTGYLTSKVGYLRKMWYFNVKTNNITGQVPKEFRYCSELEWLLLEGKRVNHSVGMPYAWGDPDPRVGVGTLKPQHQRHLHNNFTGELPKEWGELPKIKYIQLSNTTRNDNNESVHDGIQGELPVEWKNLSTLRGLWLDRNRLTGSLPPEWHQLNELNHLRLGNSGDGNNFTGSLPSDWGGEPNGSGMRKMVTFRITGGGTFSGGFPESWKNMKMLWQVGGGDLFDSGELPLWLANGDFKDRVVVNDPDPDADPVEAYHSSLSFYSFANNNFTASEFPNPANLPISLFLIRNNDITVEIAPNLNDFVWHLVQFRISNNNIYGEMGNITNWSRTKLIEVENNKLSGSLPLMGSNNRDFENGQFQNNNFTSIPAGWGDLPETDFLRLWLHNNNLAGAIPAGLANKTYGGGLRLHNNRFVFADLVPFLDQNPPSNTTYAPQKNFGSSEDLSGSTIDFSSRVTHNNNSYQWFKDGSSISGETSNTIDTSAHGAGEYQLRVINSGAPDLTLWSKQITV